MCPEDSTSVVHTGGIFQLIVRGLTGVSNVTNRCLFKVVKMDIDLRANKNINVDFHWFRIL